MILGLARAPTNINKPRDHLKTVLLPHPSVDAEPAAVLVAVPVEEGGATQVALQGSPPALFAPAPPTRVGIKYQ